MDVDDTSKVYESDSLGESVHDVTRQDEIDPKSESQFSSFMSYHEGESSSLDPGTNGKEFCKSPIEDSSKRHDSGVVDQGDINPHDSDLIAYVVMTLVCHPLTFLTIVIHIHSLRV